MLSLILSAAVGVPAKPGAASAKTPGAAAIEHVVLLLMENRPFDQFYGFAQPVLKGKIDGLTGNECFPTRAGVGHAKPAEDLEFDGEDEDDDWGDDGGDDGDDGDDDDGREDDDEEEDDDGDDDGGDDEVRAADVPEWGLNPSHPLDGKTQILFNVFDKDSGVAEDKYVSFAYTDTPPGESGALHWLRATYTAVKDAMPVRFEAVKGSPNAYKLKNTWPGYEGYLCEKEQQQSVITQAVQRMAATAAQRG